MFDIGQLKRLILPVIKGSPLLLLCLVVALLIAWRSLLYTNPVYETTAKIKLDDINTGISSSGLYQDFDHFVHTNKIPAEVEVLKSPVLIDLALQKVDLSLTYHRLGQLRDTELYIETPFLVDISQLEPVRKNMTCYISIESKEQFRLASSQEALASASLYRFGQAIPLAGATITISLNKELLAARPHLDLVDQYRFEAESRQSQIDFVKANLDVMQVDKEVAVLRLGFKAEVAQKASDVLNALAETYIEDNVAMRTGAASQTTDFIQQQIRQVAQELTATEIELRNYRQQHGIVDARMEKETDLRHIAQLKVQLANLTMNQQALDSLEDMVNSSDQDLMEMAPVFSAFSDLLSVELIKRLNQQQNERKELLLKYKPADENIRIIDAQIADIIRYIRESIRNARTDMGIKRQRIETILAEEQAALRPIPEFDRRLTELERNFQLKQQTYNFLIQKEAEASIAQAADISFHRIIQWAVTPSKPVSPRNMLIMIVSGFLGLMTGLTIIYARLFINGKIQTREQLEKLITQPVIGVIPRLTKREMGLAPSRQHLDFASSLYYKGTVQKGQVISVCSGVRKEGKTFFTQCMGQAYSRLGWRVLIIDLDWFQTGTPHEPGIAEVLRGEMSWQAAVQEPTPAGLSLLARGDHQDGAGYLVQQTSFAALLGELREAYDLVLLDLAPSLASPDMIASARLSDLVLYLVRANYTRGRYLRQVDLLAAEYQLHHIHVVLNAVHRASSYNGYFLSSRLRYRTAPGWWQVIKQYYSSYVQ